MRQDVNKIAWIGTWAKCTQDLVGAGGRGPGAGRLGRAEPLAGTSGTSGLHPHWPPAPELWHQVETPGPGLTPQLCLLLPRMGGRALGAPRHPGVLPQRACKTRLCSSSQFPIYIVKQQRDFIADTKLVSKHLSLCCLHVDTTGGLRDVIRDPGAA